MDITVGETGLGEKKKVLKKAQSNQKFFCKPNYIDSFWCIILLLLYLYIICGNEIYVTIRIVFCGVLAVFLFLCAYLSPRVFFFPFCFHHSAKLKT